MTASELTRLTLALFFLTFAFVLGYYLTGLFLFWFPGLVFAVCTGFAASFLLFRPKAMADHKFGWPL